jgi:hypothetical protein
MSKTSNGKKVNANWIRPKMTCQNNFFYTIMIQNVSSIKFIFIFIFMEKDSCIQLLCRLIREKDHGIISKLIIHIK